jgi:hypothetical protein
MQDGAGDAVLFCHSTQWASSRRLRRLKLPMRRIVAGCACTAKNTRILSIHESCDTIDIMEIIFPSFSMLGISYMLKPGLTQAWGQKARRLKEFSLVASPETKVLQTPC